MKARNKAGEWIDVYDLAIGTMVGGVLIIDGASWRVDSWGAGPDRIELKLRRGGKVEALREELHALERAIAEATQDYGFVPGKKK